MAKVFQPSTFKRDTIKKRTSIGSKHRPKNKYKRRTWKQYRGQGK